MNQTNDTQTPELKLQIPAAKTPAPLCHFNKDGGLSPLLTALFGLGIYLVVGIACYYLLQNELVGPTTSSVVDVLYMCIVTMTTVGYGDLVPSSTRGKIFTCVFVFVGFGLVGALLSGAANYLVEKQERILEWAVHKRENQKEEFPLQSDLLAAHSKLAVSGALVVVLFVAGVAVLIYSEGMSFVDAFYCVCITVTTLGYGDKSFHTRGGRIFAIFWILSSTVCVAQFFLYLAEAQTEERRHHLAKWALTRRTTSSDLEAAKIDRDRDVRTSGPGCCAAEFVIFKLKELGKIDEDDVQEVLKEFDSLDYDESGRLTVSDLLLSSS